MGEPRPVRGHEVTGSYRSEDGCLPVDSGVAHDSYTAQGASTTKACAV